MKKAGAGTTNPGSHEDKLGKFGAYIKALELFDLVAADMEALSQKTHLLRLVSQQLASADSVAANIEEGYGRGSRREYIQYLIIARGSARETAGRYLRLRQWLPMDVVTQRLNLCHEIVAILSSSILTLRANDPRNKIAGS